MDTGIPSDTSQALERIQEQSGGQVSDGVVGTFSRERIYLEALTEKAGSTIYAHYDYCYIRVPGNTRADHKELVQKHFPEVRDLDGNIISEKRTVVASMYAINKFPAAWDAFLRGEDLRPEGTLLSDCDAIPKERVPKLKGAGVKTVEELAALPDSSLMRIGMDARALQKAAVKWLEEHDEAALMREEWQEMKEKLAALEAQQNEGDSVNDNQDAPAKPGRRPRNNGTG